MFDILVYTVKTDVLYTKIDITDTDRYPEISIPDPKRSLTQGHIF